MQKLERPRENRLPVPCLPTSAACPGIWDVGSGTLNSHGPPRLFTATLYSQNPADFGLLGLVLQAGMDTGNVSASQEKVKCASGF